MAEKKLHEILKSGEPKSIKLVDPETGELKKIYLSKKIINEVNDKLKEQLPEIKEGGFLPLATLLPLIWGGIKAAAPVIASLAGGAAGIAQTVKTSKEAHNIGNGAGIVKTASGIFLSPTVGQGLLDFLKQQTKISKNKEFKNIFKNLKEQAKSGNGFQIISAPQGFTVKHGDGIFLSPSVPMLSPKNLTIK